MDSISPITIRNALAEVDAPPSSLPNSSWHPTWLLIPALLALLAVWLLIR